MLIGIHNFGNCATSAFDIHLSREYTYIKCDNMILDEIHPIIPIDEYISADENGDFKRNDLKSLCDNFLEKIKLEIYGFEHK